jgi:hypothetical protein
VFSRVRADDSARGEDCRVVLPPDSPENCHSKMVKASDLMATPALTGQFLYQSFRNGPITLKDGEVVGPPVLAEPWAPVGTLDVKTDTIEGDVVGTLTFRPGIALKVSGKINPASAQLPASVELKGEGHGAIYQIKGWLVPDENHIVGSVICLAGDLAKQPNGTVGPFVLFPTK